jgi:hypothetical protein
MLDGAKLGVNAIILIVIIILLLSLSLGLLGWCCVCKKRRARWKTKEREMNLKDLFARTPNGLGEGQRSEEWERNERRNRLWRNRETRERERREREYVAKMETLEVDGFGRPIGVQQPKRVMVREWKMWNIPGT